MINFSSNQHKKFYYDNLQKVQHQDVYDKFLIYCLGLDSDTRNNIDRIYNFERECIKVSCLSDDWQTSGSLQVTRMAFNLYCNNTPSVNMYHKTEEKIRECRKYSVADLFCSSYAPYFWQALQLRYPDFTDFKEE